MSNLDKINTEKDSNKAVNDFEESLVNAHKTYFEMRENQKNAQRQHENNLEDRIYL